MQPIKKCNFCGESINIGEDIYRISRYKVVVNNELSDCKEYVTACSVDCIITGKPISKLWSDI